MTRPVVRREDVRLSPDQTRVVLRPLGFGSDAEYAKVIGRVLALPEAEVRRLLDEVVSDFSSRHRWLIKRLLARFHHLEHRLPAGVDLSEPRKQLLGSYFMYEYSAESAALFNPSIIPHPDQAGVPRGALRFLLSLRSTGEGHISSISFRCGLIDAQGRVGVDPASQFLTDPEIVENSTYHKAIFLRKVAEMGLGGDWATRLLGRLGGEFFTLAELKESLQETLRDAGRGHRIGEDDTAMGLWLLAQSNYDIRFPGMALFPRKIGGRYTCGALVHGGRLVMPYGLADRQTGFASVALGELLAAMR